MRTPRKVSAALLGAVTAILVVPGSAGALLTVGVTTKGPADVGPRSVTLKAEATVSVLSASVVWQYGTTAAYGSTSGSVMTSLVGVNEKLSLPLSGLAPDTTYHVRAVAMSGLTTAYGGDVRFKTDKAPKGDTGGTTTPTSPTPPDTTTPGGGTVVEVPVPGTDTTTTVKTPPSSTTSTTKSSTDDRSDAKSDDNDDDSGDDDVATPPSQDPAADVPRGQATAKVTPVLGRTVAVAAVQGTVRATGPTGAAVDLAAARAVPNGTLIDTRAGTVELTSALDHDGATQTGRFWGGVFEVRQSATNGGLTQLVLRGGDFGACPRSGTAARARARARIRAVAHTAVAKKKATKKRKPSRSLWGSDDHGRFQTHGRGSVATVRGTRWLTQDTCAGTLTKVADGAVAVTDLRTKRTVLVRKGHQHLARVAP